MENQMKIHTIAILGAGAVGSYFYWGLREKSGENVWLVAEGERKERLEKNGLILNGQLYHPIVRTPEQTHGVDLLLVATKYTALESSLDQIAAACDSHTIVISPLNGITSEELIGSRIGMEHLLYSVMKISSMRKGNSIEFDPAITRGIIIGEKDGAVSEKTKAVEELFSGTKVAYRISDRILVEMWKKYAFNVSMNLPQAILNVGVGAYRDSKHMAYLRWTLRDEVAAVAYAKGIDIRELSDIEKVELPSEPPARYSTLQDLDAGRPTEIEMLAGDMIRFGKALNVPVPCSAFCYHAIKVLEEKNEGKFNYTW